MERATEDRTVVAHFQDSAPVPSQVLTAVATPMTQARCLYCGRRLLDYCNALTGGQVIIHKVCERCKKLNVFTLSSE